MLVDLFTRGHGGGSVRDFDIAGARRLMKAGAVVIDVRTEPETATGMLPGAKLIPVQELPSRLHEVEQLAGGDRSKPIVVHCRSGARAGAAKQLLQRAGFTQVVNAGGYDSLR